MARPQKPLRHAERKRSCDEYGSAYVAVGAVVTLLVSCTAVIDGFGEPVVDLVAVTMSHDDRALKMPGGGAATVLFTVEHAVAEDAVMIEIGNGQIADGRSLSHFAGLVRIAEQNRENEQTETILRPLARGRPSAAEGATGSGTA